MQKVYFMHIMYNVYVYPKMLFRFSLWGDFHNKKIHKHHN